MNGIKNRPLGELCGRYSEIEGLQKAHTLTYSASEAQQGTVLQLTDCTGEQQSSWRVYCPGLEPDRALGLLRYLYENAVGPSQWVELLEDLGLRCQLL